MVYVFLREHRELSILRLWREAKIVKSIDVLQEVNTQIKLLATQKENETTLARVRSKRDDWKWQSYVLRAVFSFARYEYYCWEYVQLKNTVTDDFIKNEMVYVIYNVVK